MMDEPRTSMFETEGSRILQVTGARDVGSPLNGAHSTTPCLLRLQLWDGTTSCTGIEYCQLGAQLRPGARIRVNHVKVCDGVLLLEPETVEILSNGTGELDNKREEGSAWEEPMEADPLNPPPLFTPVKAATFAATSAAPAAPAPALPLDTCVRSGNSHPSDPNPAQGPQRAPAAQQSRVAEAEAGPVATAEQQETRIDKEDGGRYTRDSFIEVYGALDGANRWEAAAPSTPAGAAPAPAPSAAKAAKAAKAAPTPAPTPAPIYVANHGRFAKVCQKSTD